jgi:hypothetical protein
MPEIGTSGLMSGERKRSVAAWPKLPRLSSTLLRSSGLQFSTPGYILASCGRAVDERDVALTQGPSILRVNPEKSAVR